MENIEIKNTQVLYKQEKVKISFYIFAMIFLILPLDNYIGTTISFPIVMILTILFVGAVFLESLTKEHLIIKKRAFYPIVFGLYMLFSGIVYYTRYNELSYNFQLLFSMLLVFSALVVMPVNNKEKKLISNIAPISVLLILIIIIKHVSLESGTIDLKIKYIVDPNYLITNLALHVSIVTVLAISKKGLKKYLLILELLTLLVFAFLIGTRGGLLTIITAMLFAIITNVKRPIKLIIAMGIVMIFIVILVLPIMPEKVLGKFSLESIFGQGGSGRLTIWKNYFKMYGDANIVQKIFGFGKDIPALEYYKYAGRNYYAHNMYIRILLEGGIIGVSLLISTVANCLAIAKKEKNTAVFSAIVAIILGSMFLDMDNMRCFWIILAFSVLNVKEGNIYNG